MNNTMHIRGVPKDRDSCWCKACDSCSTANPPSSNCQISRIIYYPGGAGNWTMNTATAVLILAVLEIGFFLFLDAFLQRKIALSPLHQLAFVLETEAYPVQAIVFVTILIVLQYEFQHFGADFTLHFEWLQDK
ncbi:hypothetical protein PRNP1_004043 [Phytophthora ramorum]